VRSSSTGIVQSVAIDVGQHLTLGTEIARVAEPRDLKAVLQVADGDVRGVAPGMRAALDSSGAGALEGHISRIARSRRTAASPSTSRSTRGEPAFGPHKTSTARSNLRESRTRFRSRAPRVPRTVRP